MVVQMAALQARTLPLMYRWTTRRRLVALGGATAEHGLKNGAHLHGWRMLTPVRCSAELVGAADIFHGASAERFASVFTALDRRASGLVGHAASFGSFGALCRLTCGAASRVSVRGSCPGPDVRVRSD